MAFNQFGEIAALEIKRGRYGDSLMHGFVEYTTEASAINAIMEMNGKKFMGRKMRVNRTNVKVGPNPGYAEWVQIHVNFQCPTLTMKVTEEFLDSVFCTFGSIGDITVKRHLCSREPAQVTGYAFVYFLDAYAALRATHAVKGVTVDGVTMECCLTYRSEQALMNQAGVANVLRLQQNAASGANNVNAAGNLLHKHNAVSNNAKRPPVPQQPAIMSMQNKHQAQPQHGSYYNHQTNPHYSPSSVATVPGRMSPPQAYQQQSRFHHPQYNGSANAFPFEREYSASNKWQQQQQQGSLFPSKFAPQHQSSLFSNNVNNNYHGLGLGFPSSSERSSFQSLDSGSFHNSRTHSKDDDVFSMLQDLRSHNQSSSEPSAFLYPSAKLPLQSTVSSMRLSSMLLQDLPFEEEKDTLGSFTPMYSCNSNNQYNMHNNVAPSTFDALFNL